VTEKCFSDHVVRRRGDEKSSFLTMWLEEEGSISGCLVREVVVWMALGKEVKPGFA
jgi:hypothetical protein